MIVVIFFRWLMGYSCIEIKGAAPESFLDICKKRGITIWSIEGGEGRLSFCCRLYDRAAVFAAAEKSGCSASALQEKGLPRFIRTYSYRAGLLAGAALGAVFCIYMSGFIWNISIIAPEGISEFELRRELEENGLYEGVRYDYNDISRTERQMYLSDDRISWVSINVYGTNAVVELSAKQELSGTEQEGSHSEGVSNLISTADGVATRLEVQSGSPVVQPGDGIRRGQLLVSGIMEYTNGSSAFCDSRGKVFARVTKTMTLSLPEIIEKPAAPEDEVFFKREGELFGIRLPLSLSTSDGGKNYYCREKRERMTLLGNDLPLFITEQRFYSYESRRQAVSVDEARSVLERRYRLYEFFLASDKDVSIIDRETSFKKEGGRYVMEISLVTEENVCKKAYVDVRLTEEGQ